MKTFAQFKHVELPDEAGNALIDAGIELTSMYSDIKTAKEEKHFSQAAQDAYNTKNAEYLDSLMKYCIGTEYKYTGIEMLKNPMVIRNNNFISRYNAVVAQILTPVAPAVVSQEYLNISEVKQIGFGETGRFIVKSNDLFLVHDLAEGVQIGGLQRLYNNEFTVNPTPKQIRYDMPFYLVAAGLFDFGKLSFAA